MKLGELQRQYLKFQSDKSGEKKHKKWRACVQVCVCKNMKGKGKQSEEREKNNRAGNPAREEAGEKLKTKPKGGRWKSK